MNRLLIEILCEEIPARMQKTAQEYYLSKLKSFLDQKKINYDECNVFLTPRRIVFLVANLNKIRNGNNSQKIKGPKIDCKSEHLKAFCKNYNITPDDLLIENNYYYCISNQREQTIEEVIFHSMAHIILKYSWPKTMRWADNTMHWVRPVKNILCLFNDKIIPFECGHFTANNITFAHRNITDQAILIQNIDQYIDTMHSGFVIIDQEIRRKKILKEIEEYAQKLQLIPSINSILLDEVVGLVEYPTVLLGKIDSKFLSLPKEVIITSMSVNQKYFPLLNSDNTISNYFIFVTNIVLKDYNEVIQGNERVLSARLADAMHLYKHDINVGSKERALNLDKIIFHSKLGSVKDKCTRIEAICNYLDKNNKTLLHAAFLCKNDIKSEMVKEFPSLQGVMGYYYALEDDIDSEIASLILNHYQPNSATDNIPKNNTAFLALADKIDNVCSLMIAGEFASSSKDPYALRRNALGCIRIILANQIHFNIKELIACCFTITKCEKKNVNIIEVIYNFFSERFKHFLHKKYGLDYHIIHQIISSSDADICNIDTNASKIHNFIHSNQFEKITSTYKRLVNISGTSSNEGKIDTKLLHNKEEIKLYDIINNSKLCNKDMTLIDKLSLLENAINDIDDFFKNIMINVEDKSYANNRLLLVQNLKNMFSKIINFDAIISK